MSKQKIALRLLFSLLALALASAAVFYAINRAPNSSFAIAGTTDVVVVEPTCGDQLTWDLPPGWVVSDSEPIAEDRGPTSAAARPAAPVTVELAAGVRAKVTREAAGVWRMRFSLGSSYTRCESTPRNALKITVGGQPLPGDPSGYEYQSAYGDTPDLPADAGAPTSRPLLGSAPPLALRLAGRIVLGQVASEGGGWGGASQPLLRSARVQVRYKEALTNQSLNLLVEEVDPGSMVDTHACLESEASDRHSGCAFARAGSSAGFLYYPTSDGEVFAQVHRTSDRIGVVPFAGVERELGVTRWAGWISTPWVQFVAAALLLASALLQGILAASDVLSRVESRRKARH